MARKGLGKGLDSLIPDFYNEDFDSNSTQSLEDMLKENESEESVEEVLEEIEDDKNDSEVDNDTDKDGGVQQDADETQEDEEDDSPSEDLPSDQGSEDSLQSSQEVEVKQEHIDEVIEIVEKNPRITLWSSKSSAVFRYLRKTEPEFSISKEASILIEEAVSKKYPEIWALFKDL